MPMYDIHLPLQVEPNVFCQQSVVSVDVFLHVCCQHLCEPQLQVCRPAPSLSVLTLPACSHRRLCVLYPYVLMFLPCSTYLYLSVTLCNGKKKKRKEKKIIKSLLPASLSAFECKKTFRCCSSLLNKHLAEPLSSRMRQSVKCQ